MSHQPSRKEQSLTARLEKKRDRSDYWEAVCKVGDRVFSSEHLPPIIEDSDDDFDAVSADFAAAKQWIGGCGKPVDKDRLIMCKFHAKKTVTTEEDFFRSKTGKEPPEHLQTIGVFPWVDNTDLSQGLDDFNFDEDFDVSSALQAVLRDDSLAAMRMPARATPLATPTPGATPCATPRATPRADSSTDERNYRGTSSRPVLALPLRETPAETPALVRSRTGTPTRKRGHDEAAASAVSTFVSLDDESDDDFLKTPAPPVASVKRGKADDNHKKLLKKADKQPKPQRSRPPTTASSIQHCKKRGAEILANLSRRDTYKKSSEFFVIGALADTIKILESHLPE